MNKYTGTLEQLDKNIRTLLQRCYEEVSPRQLFAKKLYLKSLNNFQRNRFGIVGRDHFLGGLLPFALLAAAALFSVIRLNQTTSPPAQTHEQVLESQITQVKRSMKNSKSSTALLHMAAQAAALHDTVLEEKILSKVAQMSPAYLNSEQKKRILPTLGYEFIAYHFSPNPQSPSPNWQAVSTWLRGEGKSDAQEMEDLYRCQAASNECTILDRELLTLLQESHMAEEQSTVAVFSHYVIVLQQPGGAATDSLLRYYERLFDAVHEQFYELFADYKYVVTQHAPLQRHKIFLYRDNASWQKNKDRLNKDSSIIHGVMRKSNSAEFVQSALTQLLNFTMPCDRSLESHWSMRGLRNWFAAYDYHNNTGQYIFGQKHAKLTLLAKNFFGSAQGNTWKQVLDTKPKDGIEAQTVHDPCSWAIVDIALNDWACRRQFIQSVVYMRSGMIDETQFTNEQTYLDRDDFQKSLDQFYR